MPEAAFVLSADHDPSLPELVETLRYELELQAIPSTVHLGHFPEARPDRVYVLLDPWAYVAGAGRDALPGDEVLRRTVFLALEAAPRAADAEHRAMLDRAGAVFVLDQRAHLALERLEIPSRMLRPGYSASQDRFDADRPRPVDIAFVGAHTDRRGRYLARAAPVLARHRCVVHLADRDSGRVAGATFLGDERWALLSQTKVVINLHCGEQTLLEWRRTLDAIHAGAVVVTEHSHGIAPLTPGEHLLVSSPDALPFVAESLLRDPPRLARIREAAYERLRNWIPYALPVSVLRAALVELVGEPISPGASLGSPPAARPVADRQAATTTVEREAAWRPADHEVVAQTPSWEGSSGPAVTIVTAAAGEPSDLVATLRSVTASRFADFELVIAGSDPLALEHARSWMDAHPLVPARLVRAPGPDLAGIRDAALARARGGLCLILDAGQAIYPRALEALTAGLRSAPDAAFAYSIQEVDGRSLASYRRWETWLAHRSDDLRAPALVRADRLRALGGFGTSQNGHRGLDHHLWSRMADRGWRGVLVPEPLARRSTAAQS